VWLVVGTSVTMTVVAVALAAMVGTRGVVQTLGTVVAMAVPFRPRDRPRPR
jgi:hypothetical protein